MPKFLTTQNIICSSNEIYTNKNLSSETHKNNIKFFIVQKLIIIKKNYTKLHYLVQVIINTPQSGKNSASSLQLLPSLTVRSLKFSFSNFLLKKLIKILLNCKVLTFSNLSIVFLLFTRLLQ